MRFLLTAALATLFATPALANNHFLLEGEFGAAAPVGTDAKSDFGQSFGGTFGFGGRVKGFAPAYYLVGRISRAEFSFDGPADAGSAHVERCQTDWSIGGRAYLPLTERLRLMLQVGVGQIHDESEVSRDGLRPLVVEATALAVSTQAGLQFRLNNTLSLGAAGDMAFLPDRDDIDKAASAAGFDDSGFMRMRFLGTVTAHF